MNFAVLIRKRAMAALTAIAAVVPIVAQEAWNGLVKTDMASIGATRDVSQSRVIPAPAVPFGGVIKRNVYDSTAWWSPEIAPPKGAPNVLLIFIDDEDLGRRVPSVGRFPCRIRIRLRRRACGRRISILQRCARRHEQH